MLTLTEQHAGLTLARGVVAGLWTLEQLDEPSGMFRELEAERIRSLHPSGTNPMTSRRHGPAVRYPQAEQRHAWRNLAREWIAANPAEWDVLRSGGDAAQIEARLGNARTRAAAIRALGDERHRAAAGHAGGE